MSGHEIEEQGTAYLSGGDSITYPLLLRASSLGLHKRKLLSDFCFMDLCVHVSVTLQDHNNRTRFPYLDRLLDFLELFANSLESRKGLQQTLLVFVQLLWRLILVVLYPSLRHREGM